MNQLEGEIRELERRKAEITEEVKSLDEEIAELQSEIADNADHERMRFTEAEIKAIDERYWAFAVKVDEAK